MAIRGVCVKIRNGLARRQAIFSWSSMVERSAVAWARVRNDKVAFSSKIFPIRLKTLAGWMPHDNHSIVVNKGVCNTLDAKMCTTSVIRFKVSMLKFWPRTDWTTSAKLNHNGRYSWPIQSVGWLSRAYKLSTKSPLVKDVARETAWACVTSAKFTTSPEAPNI